jgi:phenylpropionate dioxygenase-like ring-hydroxylating dioxygenase large terminal subunit
MSPGSDRLNVTRKRGGPVPSRFPFTSFPAGWFRVSAGDELPPGGVRAIHYFGRDLALFRAMDGAAHVLDAHCPHLGAHLGHGGRVQGDVLQCPFHGWRLNGAGRCVSIPYAKKIPPRAEVRSWPVREVNGQIMVYHHPRGEAPDWEVPEWPEFRSEAWAPFRKAHRWKIRTHVQELGENGMDSAHFSFLHSQQTLDMRTEAVEAEGPVFTHRTFQHYNVFGLARLWAPEVVGPLDVTLYGLGCAVNRTCVHAGIQVEYCFAFFFTPVDEGLVEVNSMLSVKRVSGRIVTRLLMAKAIREGRRTIEQDIPIWENKRYCNPPVLCEGDGPVMQYRRWARQFYPSGAGADAP